MDNFDIMTTATLRPELLKRTFDSFIQYLFKDQIKKARLIINIDLVGSNNIDKSVNSIIEIISGIPFKKIKMNINPIPSFSQAFFWCINQLESPLVFNLEEDWEMNQHVCIDEMFDSFETQKDLVHLRLSPFRSTGQDSMKVWNKFIDWNGDYFEVPENLRGTIGWAGHPGFTRSAFLSFFTTIIDPDRNPEKQIKGNYPQILNQRFGVFQPKGPCDGIIKDIGRKWMVDNGYQKKGTKAFFTKWEKTND